MGSIIIFLLILNFLIIVHELGHYIAAKRVGIDVKEFAIGLGPVLLKRNWNNTLWTLRLLPIGGYNALKGESESEGGEGNFATARKKNKLFVLFAGAFMNILIAIILFTIMIGIQGWSVKIDIPATRLIGAELISSPEAGQPRIVLLADNSPLKSQNLRLPLQVYKVSGEDTLSAEQVSIKIKDAHDKGANEVSLIISEAESSEQKEITVPFNNEGRLGVQLLDQFKIDYSQNILTRAFSGVTHSINTLLIMGDYLGSLIGYTIETKDIEPASQIVSGPVGVYAVVDNRISVSSTLLLDLLNITALISLNLGVFNLLPFPALDGWHILITFLEKLRGRNFNPELIGKITLAGFIILLLLSAIITVKDLIVLF